MQRAYDQVMHDVALQNLPVVFCLDRAGVAGADGPTHHGAFDIAYMRCLPNMVVSAPMDEIELRNLMLTGAQSGVPFSIRYPRGNGSIVDWRQPMQPLKIGTGRRLKQGDDIAILTIGAIGTQATAALEKLADRGISAAHYDMRFVKPIDEVMLHEVFTRFETVITVEDGCIMGGFGSAVVEFMTEQGYKAQVKRLGMPDRYIEHGTQEELYAQCGYDTAAIVETAVELVGAQQAGRNAAAGPRLA
jgi:1-deoxy-D-xylulose-5-phosphate synthase